MGVASPRISPEARRTTKAFATRPIRRRLRIVAVEMARGRVPLVVIQRQLGHSNLGITSIYLEGHDNAEIIDIVHARHAPMVQGNALLRR